MKYEIDDFIGVFDNVVSEEYCEMVLEHSRYLEKWKKYSSRQMVDRVALTMKDNFVYHFENEEDPMVLSQDSKIAEQFSKSFWDTCYPLYCKEYGIIPSLRTHQFSETIKLQKTQKSGGYHVWHCEHDGYQNGRRVLLVMLYLNDVPLGGETEFLYQSKRIEAKQGRVVICPTGWTHTHRGNPPLQGEKYIMNTWIEFNS